MIPIVYAQRIDKPHLSMIFCAPRAGARDGGNEPLLGDGGDDFVAGSAPGEGVQWNEEGEKGRVEMHGEAVWCQDAVVDSPCPLELRSEPMDFDVKMRWAVTARYGLHQWYGSVRILGEVALGQWICVDLQTGECLWEHRLGRPNTVAGSSQGIIVASETRSDGPWTLGFGLYGIDAKTGTLLWRSHRDGLFGCVCNALDLVPGFTNELRDAPSKVVDGEVYCASGRVLDVRTGRLLRRINVERPTKVGVVAPRSESQVATSYGQLTVSTATPEDHHRFVAVMHFDGKTRWRLDAKERGVFIGSSGFSWRLWQDFLLAIVSTEPETVPIKPEQPFIVRAKLTHRELWAVRLEDGLVVLKTPVTVVPASQCRIEDANEQCVLISADNKRLSCYSRGP